MWSPTHVQVLGKLFCNFSEFFIPTSDSSEESQGSEDQRQEWLQWPFCHDWPGQGEVPNLCGGEGDRLRRLDGAMWIVRFKIFWSWAWGLIKVSFCIQGNSNKRKHSWNSSHCSPSKLSWRWWISWKGSPASQQLWPSWETKIQVREEPLSFTPLSIYCQVVSTAMQTWTK